MYSPNTYIFFLIKKSQKWYFKENVWWFLVINNNKFVLTCLRLSSKQPQRIQTPNMHNSEETRHETKCSASELDEVMVQNVLGNMASDLCWSLGMSMVGTMYVVCIYLYQIGSGFTF